MLVAKGAVEGKVTNRGQVEGLKREERILFEERGRVDEQGTEEKVEWVRVVEGVVEGEIVLEEGGV